MKTTILNRLLATTALGAVLALTAAPASALPVLFGGGSVQVDGQSGPVTNIEPGQTVTATELLQLQAPDGSIITIEPGSVFTLTGRPLSSDVAARSLLARPRKPPRPLIWVSSVMVITALVPSVLVTRILSPLRAEMMPSTSGPSVISAGSTGRAP